MSDAAAEFRNGGAIPAGGSGAGLLRAGLLVTPGMFGSVGLNGSCSVGLSGTVNRSVVVLSLIWIAGICKQGDALYVNGGAARQRRWPARRVRMRCGASRVRSSGMLDAHGMVSDVFMEIREDKQQFKHAVALFGLRLVGALFQILHGGERVG